MRLYRELYDFAAGAGAFEGYVYPKELDLSNLPRWAGNLVKQFEALPPEIRTEIQPLSDATLGRAVQSLIPVLGEDHEVVKQLKGLIRGKLPSSSDDFQRH